MRPDMPSKALSGVEPDFQFACPPLWSACEKGLRVLRFQLRCAAGVCPSGWRDLGTAIASRELGLIYGGGKVGLMGVVCRRRSGAWGRSHRGNPSGLGRQRACSRRVDRPAVSTRPRAQSADGGAVRCVRCAALPATAHRGVLRDSDLGSAGPAPEGLRTSRHVEGFYDSFLAQIERAIESEFIVAEHRSLIQVGSDPDRLLRQLLAKQPLRAAEKWIDRSET